MCVIRSLPIARAFHSFLLRRLNIIFFLFCLWFGFCLTLWHTVWFCSDYVGKDSGRSEEKQISVWYGSLCGSECVDESMAKMRMKAKLYFIVVFTYDSFWLKIFDRVTFTPCDWCTMMSCYVNDARWLVARYLQCACVGGRAPVYVPVHVCTWILCSFVSLCAHVREPSLDVQQQQRPTHESEREREKEHQENTENDQVPNCAHTLCVVFAMLVLLCLKRVTSCVLFCTLPLLLRSSNGYIHMYALGRLFRECTKLREKKHTERDIHTWAAAAAAVAAAAAHGIH